jgi:subfamily B ATP-binding cassette protein MsbA
MKELKTFEGDLTGAKAYRALLAMAFEHKGYFGLAFIGMVVFAASDAAFAYMMKPLLDDGFIDRDPTIIKYIPVAIVLIFIIRMFAVFMRSYCMDYIGRSVIKSLRTMMFEKLLTLTSDEYDQSSTASIVTRFSYNVEQIAKSVSTSLTAFIQDSLRIIVLLCYMIWLNWQLTAIFLLAGPVVFLIVVRISGRFRSISKNIQQSMGNVTQVAQEVIDANRIVKIFGGDEFERNKFNRANLHNLKLHLKMSVAQSVSMPLIQLIVAIAFATIVAFATSDSMQDVISTGDFVSFIIAMTMLLAPMRVLSSINASIQKGIAAGESIFEFTSRTSEHNEGRLELDRAIGRIVFDKVVLCYRRSEQRVLDEVSFEIEPNTTVAIVGRSGSGKSSLVNLIPRLYEYDSGEIRLDGRRLDEYRITDLRRQIAYVGQDVRLFNDTIRNNIAYGITDQVTEEQIIDAARHAHAWEFIAEMPEQLDTEVGERGVLLSGGQRQRIAIARALLKDAPILILDEATSALDTESERHIQRAMEHLMQNRTTLVIAHRLSTIEHADHILVMDQGKVLEQGTHEQLLEKGGIYAKLHSMQFRDPKETDAEAGNKPRIIRSSVLNKSLMHNWIAQSTQRRQGWWLWSMNPLSILLMPISLVFYLGASLRRLGFRMRLLHSYKLPVTTVVVGNITLGGNGKTPIVVALHRLLQDNGYRVGIVTRGYKSGNEHSIQILSDGLTSAAAGDEANMMSEICRCPIGVGADRVAAARKILGQYPEIDVIVSDDGLQHYRLRRDIEIAVCRYMALGNGLLLPAGPLREPRSRLRQVDVVINRDSDEIVESLGEIWNLHRPEEKRNISDFQGRQVHALAGIGFPEIFFASLAQMGLDVIEHEYPDHHEFSAQELDLKPRLPILVTHKDAVKLKAIARENVWVVPLHIDLGERLSKQILQLVEKYAHG